MSRRESHTMIALASTYCIAVQISAGNLPLYWVLDAVSHCKRPSSVKYWNVTFALSTFIEMFGIHLEHILWTYLTLVKLYSTFACVKVTKQGRHISNFALPCFVVIYYVWISERDLVKLHLLNSNKSKVKMHTTQLNFATCCSPFAIIHKSWFVLASEFGSERLFHIEGPVPTYWQKICIQHLLSFLQASNS